MSKKVRGLVLLGLGVFIIIWAVQHQPSDALVNEINGLFDDTSYSMSEPWYYASIIVGAILAGLGFKDIFKGR